MKASSSSSHPSFIRLLMAGSVDLSSLSPFPHLSEGRVRQVDDLLTRLRLDDRELSGIEHLRSWKLIDRPADWATPLLARVVRQMGATDASAALSGIVHLSLGVRLIRAFGTESQIRDLGLSSQNLCAFALTEESPGSDVSRIQTYARATEEGYVLNGTKHWVTNALWATHFIVLARTAPPRASDKPRLSAFIVKKCPEIEVTPVGSDVLEGSGVGRVAFRDVKLSKTDLLGSEGKGFRLVVTGLSEARLFVGAAVVGACIRAFDDTVSRVAERRAFGRAVGNFPSVRFRVASMLGDIVAMESLVHAIAGLGEPGVPVDPVERGVVRLAVSRGATRVLDAARELHGAAAYAGDLKAARHWADARALTLLDGSDLALESYIVLEGTRDLREQMARLSDSSDVLARVDAAATRLVASAKKRLLPSHDKSRWAAHLLGLESYAERLRAAIHHSIEEHGVEFVERQHIQSRLASVSTELATWAALLARVQDEVKQHGEVASHRMVEAAGVWVKAAKARIESDLVGLGDNDDVMRDRIALRAYTDRSYPFDVF